MGKIVGIGGGQMGELETLAIDQEVVALSGRHSPRALFIPTASSDSVERCDVFQRVYGGRLGCWTANLLLLGRNPPPSELEDKVLGADLIYVGGGNTLMMMRRWRRLGVDRLLHQAHDRGTVLAGTSAGMICWFTWGHSDSMSFYHPDDWRYIRVRGMGLLDALGCPHHDSGTGGQARALDFQQMVRQHGDVGIAVDNQCAIAFLDDGYRVIAARPGVGACRVMKGSAGRLTVEAIPQRKELAPRGPLLSGAPLG